MYEYAVIFTSDVKYAILVREASSHQHAIEIAVTVASDEKLSYTAVEAVLVKG